MAKPTKRQRKFQASGGIKGRLQKGVQFGGNIKKRRKQPNAEPKDTNNNSGPPQPVHTKDDLTGSDNLGDLDINSFFAKFDGAAELTQDKEDHDDDDGSESGSNDDEKHDLASKSLPNKDDVQKNPSSSSEESGSEDEEDDPDQAQARMKEQMAQLASADPEFHEYLKENEQSLLEFGQEEEEDDDEFDGMEAEEDDEAPDAQQQHAESIELTPELLKKLARGAFRAHGIKSLRRIVAAYRSACYMSETAESDTSTHHQRYIIDSSKVFNDLMILCLNKCHKEFTYHLLQTSAKAAEEEEDKKETTEDASGGTRNESNTPLNPRVLERADRWEDMRPVLNSFFRSTLQVLSEAKDPGLLAFLLQSLSRYLRFLSPFPRISEALLKSFTGLWSAPLDSSEDYQVVRLNSFLRIRQLAITQPFPFVEDCLKKTYLAYAKRSKFGSTNSPALPTLTFMGNCLVELYNLDFHSSYQHAFIYIRQLALLLRSAIQKKTPEAFQQVHCWQYIQCVKLWVAVLASIKKTDESGDAKMMLTLVYPLTEIIFATARSSPSVRHFPLRLHCVRLLQQLAASTQTFIPTSSLLFGCLDWNEWTTPPKKSFRKASGAPPRSVDMKSMIQLGKEDPLRSHEQLEAAMKEWFLLLDREVDLYRYSAGFYEFATGIVTRLRSFLKKTRNGQWKAMGRATLERCEKYGAVCVTGRSKLTQAPKDVTVLECLKPVAEPSMEERHKALLAKESSSRNGVIIKEDTVDTSKKDSEEEPQEKKSNRKKTKNKRTNVVLDEASMKEERDEVVDGVLWSDDDEE